MHIVYVLRRPEDFVVTELTSDGQFVTLSGAVTPQQTDATADAPLEGEAPHSNHQKTNWPNSEIPQSSCKDIQLQHADGATPLSLSTKCATEWSESPPVCEELLDNHKSPHQATSCRLDKLVSTDVYQQLVSMAALYSATPSTEPPPVNLGESRANNA